MLLLKRVGSKVALLMFSSYTWCSEKGIGTDIVYFDVCTT